MSLTQILTLAVVQGITEFLPISSSAHLILIPKFTGWPDQGLLIDVAAHIGTFLAVVLYLLKDIIAMLIAVSQSFQRIPNKLPLNKEYWLFVNLVIATIPILIAGYFVNKYFENYFRSLEVIGWATIFFAILLFLADKTNMTIRKIDHITFKGALLIGMFQILALIPGTSRAGITMTAARFQGVQRQDAARFSLLLSIPVIFAAGFLKGFELYLNRNEVLFEAALTVIAISFCFSMGAISLMMFWLKRANFTPFVIYRIFLGIALLLFAYDVPHYFLS